MADVGAALSSELSKILDCPYPASLVGLADLLGRADAVTIQACIHNRPSCAARRLAVLICEALPLWDYALHVLQCLCQAPEFQHELLLQKPDFLDSLLSKAVSSQTDFEQYAKLCVLILSRPLPESIPLPAAAQSFFLRVFEEAIQDPDASTFKAVYSMLDGACRQVLDLLPLHARQDFDRQLRLILSSSNAGEGLRTLWCFGIVLLAGHDDRLGATTSPHMMSKQTTSGVSKGLLKNSSWQKLFGSTAASYKTMTLTCSNVISIMKAGVDIPLDEATQAIRIASKTMGLVDQEARESWPKSSNFAENWFRNLSGKIRHAGISKPILLEALSFHATIAGSGNLRPEMITLYQHCLENIGDIAGAETLNESLSLSIPLFAPQMQAASIQAILTKVLDACMRAPSPHQLVTLNILVDKLSVEIPNCASLRTNMLSSLSENALQIKLWNIIQPDLRVEDTPCHSYAVSLHQKLIPAVIAMLLTLALAEGSNESKLPKDLSIALISRQRNVPLVISKCSHSMAAQDRPSISFFQQACTQYTGQHLQDWRSRLKSELDSQGSYQRDLVVRSVAQICQELERRCDTVEEPLRRERERTEQLEQQVNSLTERIKFLEMEKLDYRLHLEVVEEEKDMLAHTKDDLLGKLESIKLEFSEMTKHGAEKLHTIQEELHTKEQEVQSTILRQEEEERIHGCNLEALNGTVRQLKQAQEHQEQDLSMLTERCEHLQTQLQDTDRLLSQERQNASDMAEKAARLETQTFDLETQLRGVEEDLDNTIRKLSDVEVHHREAIQALEEQLRQTELKHQADVEAAATKAEQERRELDDQLQTALQTSRQLREFYEEVQSELESLQTCVPTLEAKVQELTHLCSEQRDELDELRALRTRVLASVGLEPQKPLVIRSTPETRNITTESNPLRKPREHRRRKSAIHAQHAVPDPTSTAQDDTPTAMEENANTSFSPSSPPSPRSGGSTPKRLKPRQTFKVPAMRTPYTQKPVLKSTSVSNKVSPKKRSALMYMSPNRRHTTVGFGVSVDGDEKRDDGGREERKRRGSLHEVEKDDFDMDEIFTGTGRIPEEEEEEEGTMAEL